MQNHAAAVKLVAHLRATDAVTERDEALLVAFVELANVIDHSTTMMPGYASLWREYRGVLEAVQKVGDYDADDDTVRFLAAVRTPLGDAKDAESGDVRSSDHRRRRKTGVAVDAVAEAGRPGGRRARS